MRRPERRGRRARRAPSALRSRLPFSQSLGTSMLARSQSQLLESRVQMTRACDESSRAAREEKLKRIALRQAERGTTTSCEGSGRSSEDVPLVGSDKLAPGLDRDGEVALRGGEVLAAEVCRAGREEA